MTEINAVSCTSKTNFVIINSSYRVVLNTTKNYTEGLLIHHESGVVLRASTREPSIKKQLHRFVCQI